MQATDLKLRLAVDLTGLGFPVREISIDQGTLSVTTLSGEQSQFEGSDTKGYEELLTEVTHGLQSR